MSDPFGWQNGESSLLVEDDAPRQPEDNDPN